MTDTDSLKSDLGHCYLCTDFSAHWAVITLRAGRLEFLSSHACIRQDRPVVL